MDWHSKGCYAMLRCASDQRQRTGDCHRMPTYHACMTRQSPESSTKLNSIPASTALIRPSVTWISPPCLSQFSSDRDDPAMWPRGAAGSTLFFALLLQLCSDLPAGVSLSIRLADLLAQSDDDAFRAADVAKPIRVLVLHHFAYQLGPVGEQARDDSVDVFDGEHDATDAQRVHRRVHGPKPDRVGRVERVELDATVAVRGPHQREGGANVLEPDQAVDRRSLDLRLAFELEAEFDEERLGRLEVVDNDENVVHPLNRHVLHLVCCSTWQRSFAGANCSEKPFGP